MSTESPRLSVLVRCFDPCQIGRIHFLPARAFDTLHQAEHYARRAMRRGLRVEIEIFTLEKHDACQRQ